MSLVLSSESVVEINAAIITVRSLLTDQLVGIFSRRIKDSKLSEKIESLNFSPYLCLVINP